MVKKRYVPVRVTEAQLAWLQHRAQELGIPVSAAMRQVLEEAIRGVPVSRVTTELEAVLKRLLKEHGLMAVGPSHGERGGH